MKECLQTVEKEEHSEMCDSIPVFIEEVKAEPSVHSPERCDTGQVLIDTVENEPIVESYKVPLSPREFDERDGESYPVPPSLRKFDEPDGESFKGPHSVDESNWCVSVGVGVHKDKDRAASVESEGNDRDPSVESEGSELTTPAESELQEVNNLCISTPFTSYACVGIAERTVVWQSVAGLGSAEVVELFCFTCQAGRVHEPY